MAFSNGSLPAGFLARMQKLQPISAPSDVKRYFVSPEESGQICMLACMIGEKRNIFPKLDEEEMMTFDKIATALINENGYEVLECSSDDEAIAESDKLRCGGRRYPFITHLQIHQVRKLMRSFILLLNGLICQGCRHLV